MLDCLSEVFHWEAPKNLRRVRARVSEELARVYGFLRMLQELRPEERIPVMHVLSEHHNFSSMMKVVLRHVKELRAVVSDAPQIDDDEKSASRSARNPRGIRKFMAGIWRNVVASSRGVRPPRRASANDSSSTYFINNRNTKSM